MPLWLTAHQKVGAADRQGDVIRRHMKSWRVQKWLDGSRATSDRPTRDELEAEGYMIVKVDRRQDRDQSARRLVPQTPNMKGTPT